MPERTEAVRATSVAIRETLAVCGPLTSRELHAFFPGSTQQEVASLTSTMVRKLAKKRVYIHSWVRENDYGRDYLRAVYALGDLPDARKPRRLTNAEKCRRWKAKNAIPKAPNSVFSWAAAQA